MNTEASLYSDFSHLQQGDANDVLDRYLSLMQVKSNGSFLNIGSADGAITCEILMPKLPKNFKKLTGIDISEKMVKFAKKRCQDNPKLDFVQMDITSEKIPRELRNRFDGIFSFYCLNWVTKDRQVQALKNMFDMLKSGQNLLLTIVINTPLFPVWERLSQNKKWAPYSKDVPKYISMYYCLEEPKEKLRSLLKEAGFNTHLCEIEDRNYTYPNLPYFLKWAASLNPIVKIVPESKLGDYQKDFMEEMRNNKGITVKVENNEEQVSLFYSILVAYASKPL